MKVSLIRLLLVTIFLTTLLRIYSQNIKTPAEFFGFMPGADRMLFNYQPMIDYLTELDEASDKMEIREFGTTPEGRKMYLVFISSPENIKRLDEFKKINKELAINFELDQKTLDTYLEESKVFAMTTLSMHANEVGPAQAAPLVAYKLITSEESEIEEILDNVVLMMVPSHNPDGMDMIVNHYKKYKDTKWEGSRMPGLYHKYIGHDNNRDFVTLTQSDNEAIARVYSTEWYPQTLVEKHQMYSSGTRYFVPPNHDPIAENIHEEMWNWTWILGSNMAKDMTREGQKGISQHYLFDEYWPGATETAMWKNVISILTEAASAQHAKPIYIEPNELRGYGKGLSEYKKSINMPAPWMGGWWKLSDIVDYEITSTMSYLKTASIYRKEILKFRHDMCKNAVEKGINEAPFYYILPREQHDKSELIEMIKLLNKHGVKAYFLEEGVKTKNLKFEAGDVVIPLNQPYRAFIKEVMEKQFYPERHYTPGGELIEPYDITSWSLPLHRGLQSFEINQKAELKLKEITNPDDVGISPMLLNHGPHIAISPNSNSHYKFIFKLLAEGKEVKRAKEAFSTPAGEFPAGSFIINSSDYSPDNLFNISYFSATEDIETELVHKPEIALVETWYHDMDAGWTRWLMDQYGIEFKLIRPAEIKSLKLSEFDIIVFPDADKNVLFDGKYKNDGGYFSGNYPPEYEKGMTKEGLQNLMKYINDGGKVVSWGRSTTLFMGNKTIVTDSKTKETESFTLPVSDRSKELSKAGLSCPGTLLRVNVKPNHPLTYGLTKEIGVFSRANPVLSTTLPYFDMDRRVLATYAEKDIVLSGYADKVEKLSLQPAVVWIRKNKGQIVMLGFSPQFRGSTAGTFKLLFNALLMQ